MSPSSAPPPVLEVRGLCKNFGAHQVARDVSFELKAGARHALIGPNGAGKTSLVNLISGRLQPTAGTVLVNGQPLTSGKIVSRKQSMQAKRRSHILSILTIGMHRQTFEFSIFWSKICSFFDLKS